MNKLGINNVIWGILLILFGVTAFVDTFFNITVWGWIIVLLIGGLITAAVNWTDRSNFVNFIPTYVLWAIAGLIFFITVNILNDETVAVYVLWVIGLPFLIGYLRNQTLWGLLIPAYVLFSVGLMVGLIGTGWLNDFLVPAYVMLAIAVPFLVVYLRDRKNWWALIPAGIMGTIAVGFLLASPAVRFIIPIALVAIGAWILIRTFMRK